MNSAYSILAPIYDRFNGGSVDYSKWSDFITEIFAKYGITPGMTVLDLACGTGMLTLELAKRGFDMIGVDLSPDMLCVARERLYDAGYSALLLCQDMCELDLYGTVDGAVSTLDSINYLTGDGELEDLMGRMKNFVAPGGIFVFDVNTKRKFEEVYGDNVYTYDEDGIFCVWQNSFDKESGICDFDLTFFEKQKSGYYRREEEFQRERYYSHEQLSDALNSANFDILSVVSDYNFTPAADHDLRHYYICRRRDQSGRS